MGSSCKRCNAPITQKPKGKMRVYCNSCADIRKIERAKAHNKKLREARDKVKTELSANSSADASMKLAKKFLRKNKKRELSVEANTNSFQAGEVYL